MSTANSHPHPGLSFGVGGLRRGFPPPPPNKPPPSLSQHASPYQPQAYPPQQQPTQGAYSHSLFTTPTPPQVGSVGNVPNASRPPQAQVPPTLPGPRQRAAPPRQLQPQPSQSLSYLQQAMNHQQLPQQPPNLQPLSQPLSQQSLSQQSVNQQPMNQQSMSQQSMNQQSMSQQPMSQQPMSQQPMSQQPMSQSPMGQPVQQNGPPPLPPQQQTPHIQTQPSLPPQQPPQTQLPQVQQVQQVQQQPTPPQPEPAAPAHSHDDDMEGASQDESGEGDTSLDPKVVDGTPFVPRPPMGELMSAPPEGGSFPTLDAVHKYVLEYCTSVGYAIVIGRSKKTVPGLKKVLFVCDRAGKPPRRISPEMRKRKTSSRKCDCQFGFFAIEQRTQWTVRYRPDPIHLKHNHGPSESPLLHPAARKLDSKMVAAVKSLKESGVGVSQTLEILQAEHPHVPLLPRDIYNARAAINRNPQKVATGLAENRPAIYSKPHPSAEERIRADLRRELSKAREDFDKLQADSKKEIDDLKEKLREKDKIIEKFEMFIDICNQRVMVQRERLASDGNENNGGPGGAPS